MKEKKVVGRPNDAWSFNYQDIANVTGEDVDTVRRHRNRGYFDPTKIHTVACYFARFGTEAVKTEIMQFALAKHAPGQGIPKPGAKRKRA